MSSKIIFSEKSDSVRLANLPVLPDKSIFIHISPIEYSCTDVHLLILYHRHTEKSIFNHPFLFIYGHFLRIVHKCKNVSIKAAGRISGTPETCPPPLNLRADFRLVAEDEHHPAVGMHRCKIYHPVEQFHSGFIWQYPEFIKTELPIKFAASFKNYPESIP
mgnify:CR=1 FL=1